MTLDKAIEILEQWYKGGFATRIDDMNPAIKLGINALIFYRKLKASNTGEIQGNFIGED